MFLDVKCGVSVMLDNSGRGLRCVCLMVLALVLVASPGYTGERAVVLTPNAETGLFALAADGEPLMTTSFVGWAANWKWDHPAVKMAPDGRSFTVTFARQGLSVEATRTTVDPTQHRWDFVVTAAQDVASTTGAGIEMQLNVNTADTVTLLPQNGGVEWPEKELSITFSPGLVALYEEPNKRGRVRAMFAAASIKKGTTRFRMTVKLPAGSTQAASLAERYGKTEPTTWLAAAIDPQASFIDLSQLNEKPAGGHGFVRVKGDQYVFADGTPARFWGANVQAYSLFVKDDETIRRHARRLAALGFNLVRLHHHDSARWVQNSLIDDGPTSQKLRAESLDRYFFWVKCLRDEGIYVWIDLNVGRTFRAGDEIPGFDEVVARQNGGTDRGVEMKGYAYVNERVQALMRDFNVALLSTVNPHTGLALKDDPAVMGILLTNENDLTSHYGNALLRDKHVPQHTQLFSDRLEAFAKRSGLAPAALWQTWVPGPSKIFLNDLEAAFNQRQIKELRDIGVRVPIATCQMWGNNGIHSLPALSTGDVVDAHAYSHGEFLDKNPRHTADFIQWLAYAQIAGKPMTITEYNIEDRFHPNDGFTAPLYVGAMAAFQGWDAPMLYGYSQDGLGGAATSAWSSYMNPAIIGLMPAAALMYRQGHVQPATTTVRLELSAADLFGSGATPATSVALRTIPERHRLVIAMPAVPELPWLQKSPPATAGETVVRALDHDAIPAGESVVESDTGEIRRDWSTGVQTINTPKSQAAIGWLGGRVTRLKDTVYDIRTPKAAVVFSSLDGKALRGSSRILLSAVARVRAENAAGGRRYRSERVEGTLTFRHDASSLQVIPLAADGNEGHATTLRPAAGGVYTYTLTADAPTHWYLIRPTQ